MSVQFGKCSFDGKPADSHELDRVRQILAPYGPDMEGSFCRAGAAILYRGFHTTEESRDEVQPHITGSGAVITWTGRLDNRDELLGLLGREPRRLRTDIAIVASAYDRWGTEAFSKLVGDWALSIWNPKDQSIILAKDFLGTRHLYYSVEKDAVTWCAVLDPLVLLAGRALELEHEYVAGWLSFFPATHLSPYVGIHSVPPSSFVRIRGGAQNVNRYWDFDPAKKIRYRADGEYEENFRALFLESVRRRLRSNAPVLAELSGGMDSSAIVCMADNVVATGDAETSRLDTISYYDDSEPNWDERPYFTKVEEKRGRTGCHIRINSGESFKFDFPTNRFSATPNSSLCSSETAKQSAACMKAQGNRILLSGIGGDEVMGGVPTPVPELCDLLARAKFRTLIHQLKVWALQRRTPWFHLLFETAAGFFAPGLLGIPNNIRPAPWLERDFVNRHPRALTGYPARLRLFGPLPSFQENLATLELVRRQLHCELLPAEPTYEKRYPYLDRELLEFVYAIPREQLVRPGQRRSLMRRALVGIVPREVLNRKSKAFVASVPDAALAEWIRLLGMPIEIASVTFGILDVNQLLQACDRVRRGQVIPIVPLMRTFLVESWLRSSYAQGILIPTQDLHCSSAVGPGRLPKVSAG